MCVCVAAASDAIKKKKKKKKEATFAWRTARRGAARVSDAPSIFVSLMWPRSPGEVITALLVNGRHAWLVWRRRWAD